MNLPFGKVQRLRPISASSAARAAFTRFVSELIFDFLDVAVVVVDHLAQVVDLLVLLLDLGVVLLDAVHETLSGLGEGQVQFV